MSDLHTKLQETPNQVIANLDDLFTEIGITICANEHLVLRLGEQHNAASLPPASASVYALKGQPQLRFEGGEHTAIGDTTLLRFIKDAPAIPAAQVELHLHNGLALTYGQVVALGGDFYGIPDQPISDGATPEDRTQRFASAFNSLPFCRPPMPRRSRSSPSCKRKSPRLTKRSGTVNNLTRPMTPSEIRCQRSGTRLHVAAVLSRLSSRWGVI